MSDRLQEAEKRMRQAEERRANAEHDYRQVIKLGRPNADRIAAYTKLKTARTRERAARIKLVRIQEASSSPAWGPTSDIDLFEAAELAVSEVVGAEGKDQAGVLNALAMAKRSLIKSDDLGICERIEAYAWIFQNTLKDCRGFYLFVNSCESMAEIWVEKSEGKDIKTQTAAIIKAHLPNISEIYVKRTAEYQRRREAGRKALFDLAS